MTEFTRCERCGIIFPRAAKESICPKCQELGEEEPAAETRGKHEILRDLKNIIRDAEARGVFLTVAELSERTEIEESTIWEYIQSGEIDTASFDDPQVREFIVRKRREQMKSMRSSRPPEPASRTPAEKLRGFHSRADDEKKR
jgi:hypothetical protein